MSRRPAHAPRVFASSPKRMHAADLDAQPAWRPVLEQHRATIAAPAATVGVGAPNTMPPAST